MWRRQTGRVSRLCLSNSSLNVCFLKIRLLGSDNWEQLGSVEQSVWPVASVGDNLDSVSIRIWDTSCRLVGPGDVTFPEHIIPSKTTVSSMLSHPCVLRWGTEELLHHRCALLPDRQDPREPAGRRRTSLLHPDPVRFCVDQVGPMSRGGPAR